MSSILAQSLFQLTDSSLGSLARLGLRRPRLSFGRRSRLRLGPRLRLRRPRLSFGRRSRLRLGPRLRLRRPRLRFGRRPRLRLGSCSGFGGQSRTDGSVGSVSH